MRHKGNPASRGNVADKLERIYAQVPDVACKGLCQDSCHSLGVFPIEQRRVYRATGMRFPPVQVGACPALTAEGRCGIRDVRHLLCRFFGAVDHPLMRCPHGCEPEGGLLPDEDARRLMAETRALTPEPKPEPDLDEAVADARLFLRLQGGDA